MLPRMLLSFLPICFGAKHNRVANNRSSYCKRITYNNSPPELPGRFNSTNIKNITKHSKFNTPYYQKPRLQYVLKSPIHDRPSIACEVLSLYNRSTLTTNKKTNKKAGCAVVEPTTQPYPNADVTSERTDRILSDLRPQRRSFLFLVREVENEQ